MAKQRHPQAPLLRLLEIFSFRDRVYYGIGLLCSAGSGTILPLMTLIFGKFVTAFNDYALGRVSDDAMLSQISHYALYFVYLFIARVCLSYISMVLFTIVSTNVTAKLQQRYLNAVLHQSIPFHDTELRAGAVAETLGNHASTLRSGLSDKMGMTMQHSATVITAFAVAISSVWNLALATAAGIPASVIVIGSLSVLDDKFESQINALKEQASTSAHEVLSSIRTVRALGATDKLYERYEALLKSAAAVGWKKSSLFGVMVGTYMFVLYAAYALAFWYGIRLFADGSVQEAGKVITTLFSIMIGMNSFSQLAAYLGQFMGIVSAATELFSLDVLCGQDADDLNVKTQTEKQNSATVSSRVWQQDIVFEDVTFRYPSRPDVPVLKSLAISIPGGKQTAIIGQSGCGKSTIVALLLRWYESEAGSIQIGNMDLADAPRPNVRANIGLVQQEPRLFSGTILENIEFGLLGTELANGAPEEKRRLTVEACIRANANDFITALPQGYETYIGDRGTQLSGGQKQRIAIARAIIKNPAILILDEATSALDTSSEAVIQQAIENASQNRTVICIAHRLSTVKNSDKIIVLQNGGLLEEGTHTSLIEKADGLYSRLWNAQTLTSTATGGGVDDSDSLLTKIETVKEEKGTQQHSSPAIADIPEARIIRPGTLRTIFCIVSEYRRFWFAYLGLIFCSVIAGSLYPVQAILYARSVSAFQLTGSSLSSAGNFWGLMWFIVALVVAAAYFGLSYMASGLGETVSQDYRSMYFKAFLHQPIAFFDMPDNGIGKIVSQLSTDPETIHQLAGGNMTVIITVMVSLVSTITLALAVGWKYALVVLAGGLPVIFLANFVRERMENTFQENSHKTFTECVGYATECVESIRTVSSLNMENYVEDRFGRILSKHCHHAARYALRAMVLFALSESVDLLCMALAFWYGGTLLVNDGYSTNQFFIVFISIVFGSQSAGSYFAHSSDISKGVSAVHLIKSMDCSTGNRNRDRDSDTVSIDSQDENTPLFEFKDVEFSYPARPDRKVLCGLNIKLLPGQFVAVVGESGSGKSTITQLLERFYDVDGGKILLNGRSLQSQDPDAVRKQLSLVSQEPVLYHGTIKENLLLGTTDDPTDDRIDEILEACQLSDLVNSLPERLHTPVGKQGTALSGGQRQRLAIARAMLQEAPVLLLDEATSALDSVTERLIQNHLIRRQRSQRGNKCGILAIAHRLSTVRDADIIYVMRQGRVVEQGRHEQLMQKRGVYSYMVCQHSDET